MTDIGESDYFTSTIGGNRLFFSYEVCGAANAYTSESCAAELTEGTCVANSKCAWSADACAASVDQQTTARTAAGCDALLDDNMGPSQCRCIGSNHQPRLDAFGTAHVVTTKPDFEHLYAYDYGAMCRRMRSQGS